MKNKIILIVVLMVFLTQPVANADMVLGVTIPTSLVDRYITQLFKRHPKLCKTTNTKNECIEQWTDKEWGDQILKMLLTNDVRKQDRIDRRSVPVNAPNDYNEILENYKTQ